MTRTSLLAAVLALAATAGAHAATSATVVIQTGPRPLQAAPVLVQPPPPPPHYERAPHARRGMVWSQGYWQWRGHQYVWIPGQWVRVRQGFDYRQPQWAQRGGQWVFIAGDWSRHEVRRDDRRDRYDRHDRREREHDRGLHRGDWR